jgi:hypothetical protein
MKTHHVCSLLAIVVALTACATVTKISGAWKNPEYQGGALHKLLVIGVGNNTANSRLFEDELAKALIAKGTMAAPGYRVLPDVEQLSEDDIAKAVEKDQYDAVIVTRLLAVDKDTPYVPPRSYAVPAPYMGMGYYGYYRTSYSIVHGPGYVRTDTTVRLETNLYESRTAKLVWSGHSNTFDPPSVNDTIASVTRAITQRLAKDGLIGQ